MGFSNEFLKEEKVILKSIEKYERVIEEQKDKLDIIFEWLENAEDVHVYGKGRSGNAAVGLALRLKHFGYKVSFIGDVIKERIKKGSLVFLFSGSGETSEIVDVAKRAKKENARVIGITSFVDSSLAKYSDLVFILPGGMEKRKGWDYLQAQLSKNKQIYGGGEFELLAYLFQENLVNAIGTYKKIPGSVIAERHERDEVLS